MYIYWIYFFLILKHHEKQSIVNNSAIRNGALDIQHCLVDSVAQAGNA